jgi:hypothetical protein
MRRERIENELRHLLEELRVALPGVQFLFAFLLMVPFNQRFERVDEAGIVLFAIALATTTLATLLLIAPSVYHRIHFRHDVHDTEQMINTFNRLAIAGGGFLGLAVTSALAFLAEFLFGGAAAVAVACASAAAFLSLWYLLPLVRREREHRDLNDRRRERMAW